MESSVIKIFINVLLIFLQISHIYTDGQFRLKSLKVCNPKTDYKVMFDGQVTSKNNMEYLTVTANVTQDLSENDIVEFKIDTSRHTDNAYVHLFTLKEKFCQFMKKYGNILMLDIQRAAQITPGTCPIPKAVYHLNNYAVNTNMLTIKSFPQGRIKCQYRLEEAETQKEITCLILIIDHK